MILKATRNSGLGSFTVDLSNPAPIYPNSRSSYPIGFICTDENDDTHKSPDTIEFLLKNLDEPHLLLAYLDSHPELFI